MYLADRTQDPECSVYHRTGWVEQQMDWRASRVDLMRLVAGPVSQVVQMWRVQCHWRGYEPFRSRSLFLPRRW